MAMCLATWKFDVSKSRWELSYYCIEHESMSKIKQLHLTAYNCVRRRRALPNFVGSLWTLAKALRVFWAFYRAASYDVKFSLRKGFCLVWHKILSSSRTSGVGGRVVEEFRSCCCFLGIFSMLLKNFVAAYQSLREACAILGFLSGEQLWRQFVTCLGFTIKGTVVHVAV